MQILCTFVVVGYQPKLEKRDQNEFRTCQKLSDMRFLPKYYRYEYRPTRIEPFKANI